MKKSIVILIAFIGLSFFAQAQVSPHAIGVRFGGDGRSNGAELSYQHGTTNKNRFEFDLGFRGYKHYNDVFLSGTYQWVFNIVNGFNWYVGPGAALGLYNYNNNFDKANGISLGLGGQIGLEYNFNKHGAPLLVSLDSRPMFDFIGYDNGFGWGGSLALRYTWKK